MRRWAAGIAVGCWLWATPAAAAPNAQEEAKALADSAYELLQKGLYEEAIVLFRRADQRFHSPVFGLFIAEAEEKRGRLLAARKVLQQVAGEELAADAPDTFVKARAQAKERLEALDGKIPTVTVTASGAFSRVTLDGETLAAARLNTPVAIDPGKHEVAVIGEDGQTESRQIDVAPGDAVAVNLSLGPPDDPGGDPVDPAPRPDDPPEGPKASPETPTWIWPAIAFGVGGAGLVMGAITGGLFLGERSSLLEACEAEGDPDVCPPSQQDDLDQTQLLGNLSTAGWVIAGVGVVAGVTLTLVFELSDDEPTATALEVSPTGLMWRGRF